MTERKSVARLLPVFLIYSGSLPFITGALLLILGFETLPLFGSVADAIAAYGLVIAIFLSGIHWGQQLSLESTTSGLFISSNILAVLVWLAWLLLPLQSFLIFLVIPQLVILTIDHSLYAQGLIKKEYIVSRYLITGVVIICLFLAAYTL